MKQLWTTLKQYRFWLLLGLILFAILYSLLNRGNKADKPSTIASPASSPSTLTTINPVTTPSPTPSSSPSSTEEKISEAAISFPDLDSENKQLYYLDDETNDLLRLDLTSKRSEKIGELSAFVNKLVWSPSHRYLLLQMENGQGNAVPNPLYQDDLNYGETIVALYDSQTKGLVRLNQNIINFSFISEDQIIYQFKDSKYNNLSIANRDGSNWKNIDRLRTEVSFQRSGSTALMQPVSGGTVQRYDIKGVRLATYTVPEEFRLPQSSWPAAGQTALYWVANPPGSSIKKLTNDKVSTIQETGPVADNFTIMWDNKSNHFYTASLEGLTENSLP